MSGLTVRPLRDGDVQEVVAVYRSAFGDARQIDAEELRSWLRNPEVEAGSLRVLERDGRVVAYGDVSVENDAVALEVAAPGNWQTFLQWAEDVGRAERVSRVRVLSYGGRALPEAAKRRGYRLWRSSYTMRIEFGGAVPAEPRLPSGITLRAYREDDADLLRAALDEAFAVDPFYRAATPSIFREFYLRARGFDPSLWLLAWDGTQLAGFVLAFPEHTGDIAAGWIESLGVRPPWRGRGLGESLLRAAFRELHGRGLRAVTLGVDGSNETGAVRLYERVGMTIQRRADNWALDL